MIHIFYINYLYFLLINYYYITSIYINIYRSKITFYAIHYKPKSEKIFDCPKMPIKLNFFLSLFFINQKKS